MIGLTGKLIFIGVLSIIVFSISLYFFNYIPDDTFITLRYAKNALRGYGLVFNRWDRVEGYSNFLWLTFLILMGKIGFPLVLSARAGSLLLSFAVIIVSALFARTAVNPSYSDTRKALTIGLPALSLSASAVLSTWSMSGTELPFFTLFLLLSALALVKKKESLALTFSATLALIRPEGLALFVATWLFLLFESGNREKTFLKGLSIALILYTPYILWKKHYFGSIIPNTYYAKRGPVTVMLGNGLTYLLTYMISYGYMLFAALYILRKKTFQSRPLKFALYITLIHWITIVIAGGDWMPNFRLLLPTTPFVLFLTSMAIIEGLYTNTALGEDPAASRAFTISAVLVILSIAPGFVNYDLFKAEKVSVEAFANVGKKLKQILPPGTTLACGSTGAIGYYSDMPIVDILGLTDSHIARKGKVVSTQPGHLKTDGTYILNRKPALLLFGNVLIHKGEWDESKMKIKIQEKEVTSMAQFRNLYEYINIPIGYGFYLSCYKRRDFFLPVDSDK